MDEQTKKEVSEMEANPSIKTIDENYENLKALITSLNQDYEKFREKKVKASGQRVRASLLNIKKLCDVLRKDVIKDIKEIPVKSRKKKEEKKDDTVETVRDEPKVEETVRSEPKEETVEKKSNKKSNKKKTTAPKRKNNKKNVDNDK